MPLSLRVSQSVPFLRLHELSHRAATKIELVSAKLLEQCPPHNKHHIHVKYISAAARVTHSK